MSALDQEIAQQIEPRSPGAYAIQVEGLRVSYGGKPVVQGFSMHVPHGCVYGLMGPSGAGKSTLLRTLATLQQPDAGTVLIDGIDLAQDPAGARQLLGYLPDFSGVYGRLTVEEYLYFYGAIYRIPPRRRRRVGDELLELMGLTHRRDDPVGALPRGMKQKLGLARCLIHDPDILLLDEPAAGLDATSRLELREMLQDLARFGKAILISSHLLADLAEVCSYLGVIREGELVVEGSVDDIRSAVLPETYLRVLLLDPGDVETASRLIAAHPACRRVEASEASRVRAWFDGGGPDLAAILGQLSRSGVRVTEFTLERPTLEEVFLHLGAVEARA